MSSGPIPWSSIDRYVSVNPGVELSSFTKIIRSMDGVYMSHESGDKKTFSREMVKGR